MKVTRTPEEIRKEIDRLSDEADNFTSDNYGSEGCSNGEYELYFSQFNG